MIVEAHSKISYLSHPQRTIPRPYKFDYLRTAFPTLAHADVRCNRRHALVFAGTRLREYAESGVEPFASILMITIIQFPYAHDEPRHDSAGKRITKGIHKQRQIFAG